MPYLNAQGHNWGSWNSDGYGVSLIAFAVIYTIIFLLGCVYVWLHREHPIIRMRKINLALVALLILHVYLFMIFMVYPLNGAFPCSVEFWTMSLYLPIGIGLYQAQNQQLLIVSREQNALSRTEETYRPLAGERKYRIGSPSYWVYRFRLWWGSTGKQGKYEGFVFVGIVVQFVITIVIYCISRKFNSYGIVGHAESPGQCRRGWEWVPSIAWQFMWNFFFGPYLIFKIRMIRDIYQWRLQTILTIVAGVPGTPLWLAAVYTDSFASINKYWVPAMWFVPGLMTMEIATLLFPILQMRKHTQAVRETTQALADFDAKRTTKQNDSSTLESGSLATRSTGSKGKMYSMESLDECLHGVYDGLQVYASCMELNGENIIFLVKVLKFKRLWLRTFSASNDFLKARAIMFRAALSIYISLVHAGTASYPINIESPIYNQMEIIFGQAASLVATCRRGSTSSTPISQVTPWESESLDSDAPIRVRESFNMKTMSAGPVESPDNDSRERIVMPPSSSSSSEIVQISTDPLAGYMVPAEFDAHAFDAAFKSIKYMVWTETWQRYMHWKRTSTIV